MNNIKRVHLMGIGGAGMSALAKLLNARGLEVSGCDLKEPHYDLEKISCELGHSRTHIKKFRPDALILSSAVRHDNEEVVEAINNGVKILSRAEALSSLFNISFGIGIAGAHGKTTTSSMTGLILLKAGLDPTIYVGANVPDIGSNAISGGENFVAELDESDGTFELFHPDIAIITNADWDHVDHYKTRDDVIRAFTRFADGRKENGTLIICAEDDGAEKVFNACGKSRGKIIRYGFNKKFDWGAENISSTHGGGITCEVFHDGNSLGLLELSVSGEHNILNSLAAVAAAFERGVSFETSANILKNFHGSERRMQLKGKIEGKNILIMDDYAHHPSEIKATLAAIKNIYPERRLVIAFQPHRFSRTAQFAPDIAQALSMADVIFLLPVFSAGEEKISHSSSEEIIKNASKKINLINFNDACEKIKSALLPGDLFLTMGAGDVYKIGEELGVRS